jgi:hypothetical protein
LKKSFLQVVWDNVVNSAGEKLYHTSSIHQEW